MRALIVIALVAACTDKPSGPGIDVDRAMTHVKALAAIGPRPHDSEGARTAATYITTELERIGVTVERAPVGAVDLPAITVMGKSYRSAHRETVGDPNLLVRFGSTGKALLFMAHYDTVPGSPGAVDNAAAVAVLLELARAFVEEAPAQPVILAFTAAEETGLVGAEALAAQRGNEVMFAIALDMIGGDGRLTLNGASELIGTAEMQWLADAADRVGIALSAPLAHRVISRWWPQAERADHGPFTRRRIRAVHFYNRGNDGEWIDLEYHKPGDVPARVHPAALADTGRLLRALVSLPMRDAETDAFWVPFVANTVIPRWLLFAIELVLGLAALTGLLVGRLGLVAQLARDRERGGAGLWIGLACYVLAVGAAIGSQLALARSHPAPWLHDPLRAVIANTLLIAGTFGLLTRLVARWKPFKGGLRYRIVAVLVPLTIGGLLVAVGAAEIAWIWLLPAAVIAIAPAPLGLLAAMVPIALVLHPWQLREAAWNGFLPTGMPLAVWVAALGISPLATAAWWLRSATRSTPLGTLVLSVGCGLAVIGGLVLMFTTEPACSAAEFVRIHLACERV